ncbi:MAG: hypothetical protein LBL52_00400 [Rickettsiales bacterium]|jgi:hypothetical protein|nr:hypothetical protein [Rickettsiales bacterium]
MNKDFIRGICADMEKQMDIISDGFRSRGIPVLMLDNTGVPQRGEILKEFARCGVEVGIVGGESQNRTFPEIPQYPNRFAKNLGGLFWNTADVAASIPAELLKNRIAVFVYDTGAEYERVLGNKIYATCDQNLNRYFEEKGNLPYILKSIGLAEAIIPYRFVSPGTGRSEARAIYEELRDGQGRVVLQIVRDKSTNYGGAGTRIVRNFEGFEAATSSSDKELKASKFISGAEANVSFFAGNTLAAKSGGLGALRTKIEVGDDPFSPKTMIALLDRAKASGISMNNILTLLSRPTLKAVGDPWLTPNPANGIGEDLNYRYPPEVQAKIADATQRIARLMALSGRVGLAGVEMLIDKDGRLFVNEINDRQQGPTAPISADMENNGLPSLMKLALISSFGNLRSPDVQCVLDRIRDNKAEIERRCLEYSDGSFYLKLNALASGRAMREFSSGTMTFSGGLELNIEGANTKLGDLIKEGSQIARITGVRCLPGSPFVIDEAGKSVLNPDWRTVPQTCYSYIFGKGYIDWRLLAMKKECSR